MLPRTFSVNPAARAVKIWIGFQQYYDHEITLNNNHFYLDGSLLANFIHDLVRRASKKIIYVSPWIEEIGVTKNLVNASRHGKKVVVVTRHVQYVILTL